MLQLDGHVVFVGDEMGRQRLDVKDRLAQRPREGGEGSLHDDLLGAFEHQLETAKILILFIPLIIATFCSTLVGLITTAVVQGIRLWDPVVLAYLGGMTALIAGLVVWFSRLDQAAMETLPVGSFRPNAFGVYDVIGNVAEWCHNLYGPYGGFAIDPPGPVIGSERVFRSSGAVSYPYFARVSKRDRWTQTGRSTALAAISLPAPDSPISPSTSPRCRVRSTPLMMSIQVSSV